MPPKARKTSTKKVDETVENQENPGTSEEARPSTDSDASIAEVPKMAPANEVDETVVNQESPGSGEFIDRNPEPQIVEDSTGTKFDVSKPFPELVTSDPETEERRARIRQTEGAMNAKDLVDSEEEDDTPKVEIVFLESGLTAERKVWRKGQVLTLTDTPEARKLSEDTDGKVWYELSADEQKERYGKVFFEKR